MRNVVFFTNASAIGNSNFRRQVHADRPTSCRRCPTSMIAIDDRRVGADSLDDAVHHAHRSSAARSPATAFAPSTGSAPIARASARRSGTRSMAKTRLAPSTNAISTAISPIGPEADDGDGLARADLGVEAAVVRRRQVVGEHQRLVGRQALRDRRGVEVGHRHADEVRLAALQLRGSGRSSRRMPVSQRATWPPRHCRQFAAADGGRDHHPLAGLAAAGPPRRPPRPRRRPRARRRSRCPG